MLREINYGEFTDVGRHNLSATVLNDLRFACPRL